MTRGRHLPAPHHHQGVTTVNDTDTGLTARTVRDDRAEFAKDYHLGWCLQRQHGWQGRGPNGWGRNDPAAFAQRAGIRDARRLEGLIDQPQQQDITIAYERWSRIENNIRRQHGTKEV
jgi:hypothetical protein